MNNSVSPVVSGQLPNAFAAMRAYRTMYVLYASLFGLLSVLGCTKPQTTDDSPEVQVVQQLSERRIVMMGDFAHEFPLPYYGLVSTLNTWLSMLRSGESREDHLVLFLEEDRQVTSLLSQYLDLGDIDPLLDFLLPSTSIERLEFYRELRRVAMSVDSLNKTLPQSRRISFEVQGPEARNVLDPTLIDSSRRASILYFVQERDRLTAESVIAHLKDHPQSKGLVFFGNAHLLAKPVRKDYSGVLNPGESEGKYLGYYLKKRLETHRCLPLAMWHKRNFQE